MKKFDKLYEGILSNLGKKVGSALRKGAETAEKGAETAEKGIKKAGRTVAKKTIEKTPLGFVKTANRALKKLNNEFNSIVSSTASQYELIQKLVAKITDLKGKIANRYQDEQDNETVKTLTANIDSFASKAKKVASTVKGLGTMTKKKMEDGENKDEPVTESYTDEDFQIFCEEWEATMGLLDSAE